MPRTLNLISARSYNLLLALMLSLLALTAARIPTGEAVAPQPPARLTLVGYLPGGLALSAGGQPVQLYYEGAESILPTSTASLDAASYPALWPGVDLTLARSSGSLRGGWAARFTLSPGADPAHLRFKPSLPVEIQPDGGLRVDNLFASRLTGAPSAWQMVNGLRVPVDAALVVSGSGARQRVHLWLGDYDPAAALVIDLTFGD